MSGDLSALNLADLVSHYRDREITAAVQRVAQSERFRSARAAETAPGGSIDERALDETLMRFYSLAEVASIAGYIPPYPKGMRRSAIRDIALIEDTSRYPLVKLHLMRLLGDHRSAVKIDIGSELYASFLDLDRLATDEAVQAFVAVVEENRSEDLVRLESTLRDPKVFMETMSVPPPEQQEQHLALHGCATFLAIVSGLNALLSSADGAPLLQSALWYHYARWFDRRRSTFASTFKNCIHQFSTWQSGEDANDETAAAVGEVEAAVDRLVWSTFYAPIDQILFDIRAETAE